jgi:hypothetical protein
MYLYLTDLIYMIYRIVFDPFSDKPERSGAGLRISIRLLSHQPFPLRKLL